jgi:endonuclease/exonuclease/phosphatase (EEP) superfamily protein YafD
MIRTGLPLAALAAAFLVSVPLVLGFLAALHPALDSIAHFRGHLAVLMGLLALPALATRHRVEAAATLALALAALWTTLDRAAEPASGDGAVYRLLHLNLRFDNATPGAVLSLVGGTRPDVIVFTEVSEMWAGRLEPLAARYPHRIHCEATTPIGSVAILSARPFAADRAPTCHDRGSLAVARIDLGGRGIDVAALHLGWPWPFEQWAQVARVAPHLATLGDRAVLAGDFNATSWSHALRSVEAAGGLARVPGSGRTWLDRRLPASLRRLAGLPIDHVMTRGGVVVKRLQALDDAGSDHLPLLLEFGIESVPDDGGVEQVHVAAR